MYGDNNTTNNNHAKIESILFFNEHVLGTYRSSNKYFKVSNCLIIDLSAWMTNC